MRMSKVDRFLDWSLKIVVTATLLVLVLVLVSGCGAGDKHNETSIFCDISFEVFEELQDSNDASIEAVSMSDNSVVVETDADFCQFIQEGDTTTNTQTTDTDIEANAQVNGQVEGNA